MSLANAKKVLVVHFSQTGQLSRVLASLLGPLETDPGIQVVQEYLEPERPFPFPWPLVRFFDVFPECVHLDPPPLKPVAVDPDTDFDLIIIGYQPWFLSPSLPITAFMVLPEARRLMEGRPVVTTIACRNMWLKAQEAMKRMIADNGGRLIDNVVLVDQGSPAATFVTTPRWLLTGRKDRFLGIFPEAGVSERDIRAVKACGERLREALKGDSVAAGKPVLEGVAPTRVDRRYIVAEKMGWRSFRIWGALIRTLGPPGSALRVPLLLIYALFLATAILTVVPLSILVRRILELSPTYRRHLDVKAAHYAEPYGQSSD